MASLKVFGGVQLRRAGTRFETGREAALATLREAEVVFSAETGVRIEGSSSFP